MGLAASARTGDPHRVRPAVIPVGTGQPGYRRGPPAREEFRRDRLMVSCVSRSLSMPYDDAQIVGYLRQAHNTTLLTEREKHLVGLAVTMTRGCQVCTRNRIEKARAAGIGDDVLNVLVNVVSSVNAGVTAATAREAFRLADAAATEAPCNDLCATEGGRT